MSVSRHVILFDIILDQQRGQTSV